jgi:hypothetical protein
MLGWILVELAQHRVPLQAFMLAVLDLSELTGVFGGLICIQSN